MVSPTTPQTVAFKRSEVVMEDVNQIEYSTDNDKDPDISRDLIKFNEVPIDEEMLEPESGKNEAS